LVPEVFQSVLMTPKRPIPDASQSFPNALAALAYEQRVHSGQRRQADGAPFILHPPEVCRLLYHAGAHDHVIAATDSPLVTQLRAQLEKPALTPNGQSLLPGALCL
jgi:(p)ppGpp synthase/HD superfamily hydrolase